MSTRAGATFQHHPLAVSHRAVQWGRGRMSSVAGMRAMMIETLRAALGEKVSVNQAVLETHGRDENYPHTQPPLAVVFAESVADVQATLAWAREHYTPVIPFSAGTSLEGHVVPQGAAISLDLSRMSRILEVRPADFLAVAEPGVTRTALNAALRDSGLFFPVDPGADASVGGMAATNASGTTTVRYGGMRANVLELEVVLAGGRVIRAGSRAVKTSAGYHVAGLFLGSEGTLGVITELTLRLHPIPEHIVVARAAFPSVEAACGAAASLIAAGVQLTRCELLDAMTIEERNAFTGADLPV